MSLITEKDVNGYSAVHYAAKKGDTKVRCKTVAFWALSFIDQLVKTKLFSLRPDATQKFFKA